ncbi:type IV toxin-antitoxin system AbiEi family antitoxin domain-containing protein [Jatrophihabitans sp. YIM 134969]
MRPVPSPAVWRCGVFTVAEAQAEGWTPSALRHAVRAGRLIRLRPGVFAVPPLDGPGRPTELLAQRAVGAAVANHGVHVSHLAAARLARIDSWAPEPHPCVTHSGTAVSAIEGVHAHRADLPPSATAVLGVDLLVTAPGRTVVDVAREFGVEAGVVVADSALRTRLGARERLDHAVRQARGRPRVDRARSAVEFADARSESVLESRSRHRMAVAGLPAPLTQVDILTLSGRLVGRADFYWPEFGVIGEADGLGKYDGFRSLTAEKLREDALRDLGLEIARWVWDDLEPFDVVRARIERAFARGAVKTGPRRWRAVQRPWQHLPPRKVV